MAGELKIDGIDILNIAETVEASSEKTKPAALFNGKLKIANLTNRSETLVNAPDGYRWKDNDIIGNKLKMDGVSDGIAKKGTRPNIGSAYKSLTFSNSSFSSNIEVIINKDSNGVIVINNTVRLPLGMDEKKNFYLMVQGSGGSGSGGGSGGGGAGGGAGACACFAIEAQYLPMTVVLGYRGEGERGYDAGLPGGISRVTYRGVQYTLNGGEGGERHIFGPGNISAGGNGGTLSSFSNDVMVTNIGSAISNYSGAKGGDSKKAGGNKIVNLPANTAVEYPEDSKINTTYTGGTSNTSAGANPGGGGGASHSAKGGNGGKEWEVGSPGIYGSGGGGGGWTDLFNNRSGGHGGAAGITFFY